MGLLLTLPERLSYIHHHFTIATSGVLIVVGNPEVSCEVYQVLGPLESSRKVLCACPITPPRKPHSNTSEGILENFPVKRQVMSDHEGIFAYKVEDLLGITRAELSSSLLHQSFSGETVSFDGGLTEESLGKEEAEK